MATSYVILHKPAEPKINGGGAVIPSGWQVLDKTYDAASSSTAERAAADEKLEAGEYRAVPARSWGEPLRIEIETNPRVKVVKS